MKTVADRFNECLKEAHNIVSRYRFRAPSGFDPKAQKYVGTDAAATQTGTATTGVTIQGTSGVITTVASTLASAGTTVFTVTNGAVKANSAILVGLCHYGGTTGTPVARANNVVAGAFDVVVANTHASAALNGLLKVAFQF